MDFHSMKRKELQALCKKHNIPANLTNLDMANKLSCLVKDKEKPITRGRSCLKDLGELASVNVSDETRNMKKVRFSPENEMIEFVDLESDPREARLARRRSMGRPVMEKNKDLVFENVDSNDNIVDNTIRNTRSRAQKSVEEVVKSVPVLPIEKKRPRRGVSTDSLGAKDADRNVVDSSSKLASETAAVEETGVPMRRSLRNREVMSENENKGEIVGVQKNMTQGRMKNAKGSKKISENKGLAADGESTQSEKPLPRTKQNAMKIEDAELLNGELGQNKMVGRGRITRSRTQRAVEETEVEVQEESEKVIELEEPLVQPGRNGNRQKSVMHRSEKVVPEGPVAENENRKLTRSSSSKSSCIVEIPKENEKDSLPGGPLRRSRRNTSSEPPVEHAKRLRQNGLQHESVAVSDALDGITNAIVEKKPRKRRRDPILEEETVVTEFAPLTEEPSRRSKRNAVKSNLVVPEVVTSKVVGRKKAEGRSKTPIVDVEAPPLIESTLVIEEPPLADAQLAMGDVVESTTDPVSSSCKQSSKDTTEKRSSTKKVGRSKTPILEVEEQPLIESTLVIEEPPLGDAQLAMGDGVESATNPVSGSCKQSSKDTTEKKSSTKKVGRSKTPIVEVEAPPLIESTLVIEEPPLADAQLAMGDVVESTTDPVSSSCKQSSKDTTVKKFSTKKVGRSKTPIVEVEAPPLIESTLVIEEPPVSEAQLAMGDVVESATDPVISSHKKSSKDTTEKKSSTKKVVCPGTSDLEKARDFIFFKSIGTPASESAKMQSDYSHKEEESFSSKAVVVTEKVNISFGVDEGDPASQSLERSGNFHCNDIVEPQPEEVLNLVNGVASAQTKHAAGGYSPVYKSDSVGVAEKENVAVVAGNENLLESDIGKDNEKDNEYALASQPQNITEDFNCTTLVDLESASENGTEISALDLSDGGRVTPNMVGDNVEDGLLETMSDSHVMPAKNVTEVQLTSGYFSPGKPSCKSIVAPAYEGNDATLSTGDVLSIDYDAQKQDETRAKFQSNVQPIILAGDDMCSQERIEEFSTDMENKPEEASYLKRAMRDVDKETSYEGLAGNLFMDECCSQEAIEESSTEMENKLEEASHVKKALEAVDRETCYEELEGNPSMYDDPISISNELDGQLAKEKENEGLERNYIHVSEEIREGSKKGFTDAERISLIISEERDTDKKEDTFTPIVTPKYSGNDGSMSSYNRTPLKDDGSKGDGLKRLSATPANDRNSNEEASSHETGTVGVMMPKGLTQEVVGTMESGNEKLASKSNALPISDEEFVDEGSYKKTDVYDCTPLKDDRSEEGDDLKTLFATPANDRNSNEEASSHETGTVDVMTPKCLPREVVGTMESGHEKSASKSNALPISDVEFVDEGSNEKTDVYDCTPLKDDGSEEGDGLKTLFATPANNRNFNEEASCHETGTVDVMMPKGLPREVVGTMESEHEKSASKSNAIPISDVEFIDEDSNEKADVYDCTSLKDEGSEEGDGLKTLFATPANERNSNEEAFSHESGTVDVMMPNGVPREVVGTMESEHEKSASKSNALPISDVKFIDEGSNEKADVYDCTPLKDDRSEEGDGLKTLFATPANDRNSNEEASIHETGPIDVMMPKGVPQEVVGTLEREHEKSASKSNALPISDVEFIDEGSNEKTDVYDPTPLKDDSSEEGDGFKTLFATPANDRNSNEEASSHETRTVYVMMPKSVPREVVGTMESEQEKSASKSNVLPISDREFIDEGSNEKVDVEFTCSDRPISQDDCFAEDKESEGLSPNCENYLGEITCLNALELSAGVGIPSHVSKERDAGKIENFEEAAEDTDAKHSDAIGPFTPNYVSEYQASGTSNKEMLSIKHNLPTDDDMQDQGAPSNKYTSGTKAKVAAKGMEGDSDVQCDDLVTEEENAEFPLGVASSEPRDCEDALVDDAFLGGFGCLTPNKLLCGDGSKSIAEETKEASGSLHNNADMVLCAGDSNESAEQNFKDTSVSAPAENVDSAAIPSFKFSANHGTTEHGASGFNVESFMFNSWEMNLILGDDVFGVEKLYGGTSETNYTCEGSENARQVKENATLMLAEEQPGNSEHHMEEKVEELNGSLLAPFNEPICEDEGSKEFKDVVFTTKVSNYSEYSEKEESSVPMHDMILTDIANMNGCEHHADSVEPRAEGDSRNSVVENTANTDVVDINSKHLVGEKKCGERGEEIEPIEDDQLHSFTDSSVDGGFPAEDAPRKNSVAEMERDNRLFEKQLNSTAKKRKDAKASLIQGTPQKLISTTLDMKENAPSIKREHMGNVTTGKSVTKRRALEDLRWK